MQNVSIFRQALQKPGLWMLWIYGFTDIDSLGSSHWNATPMPVEVPLRGQSLTDSFQQRGVFLGIHNIEWVSIHIQIHRHTDTFMCNPKGIHVAEWVFFHQCSVLLISEGWRSLRLLRYGAWASASWQSCRFMASWRWMLAASCWLVLIILWLYQALLPVLVLLKPFKDIQRAWAANRTLD